MLCDTSLKRQVLCMYEEMPSRHSAKKVFSLLSIAECFHYKSGSSRTVQTLELWMLPPMAEYSWSSLLQAHLLIRIYFSPPHGAFMVTHRAVNHPSCPTPEFQA